MLWWDSSDGVWLITLIRLFDADKKKLILLATLSTLAGDDERANGISRVVLAHKQCSHDWTAPDSSNSSLLAFCRRRKYFLMLIFSAFAFAKRAENWRRAKMRSTMFMTRLWNVDKRRLLHVATVFFMEFFSEQLRDG
jgi:hypothetical protein